MPPRVGGAPSLWLNEPRRRLAGRTGDPGGINSSEIARPGTNPSAGAGPSPEGSPAPKPGDTSSSWEVGCRNIPFYAGSRRGPSAPRKAQVVTGRRGGRRRRSEVRPIRAARTARDDGGRPATPALVEERQVL